MLTEPEKEELEAMWVLRNPRKPLPRSAEAEAAYKKLLEEEKLVAVEKKVKRERRLKLKKTIANRLKRKKNDDDDDEDGNDGEGDDDSSESEAEEIPEFPDQIDEVPVHLGFNEVNKKDDEDAETEEDSEIDDERQIWESAVNQQILPRSIFRGRMPGCTTWDSTENIQC